jgi:hypothetical protein
MRSPSTSRLVCLSIGDRTDEERERAREERERRRGARAPLAPPAVESLPPAAEQLPPAIESLPSAVEPPPLTVELPSPARYPIATKLPPAAPLPPRIAPLAARRGRGRAWVGIGVLALALALLGGVLAFVLGRSKPKPRPVAPIAIVRITIPEGETRLQIARVAAAKGLTGSYLKAARSSSLLDPAGYGAPRGTPNLEGFLFPATYELYAGDPASRLVAEQLTAFEENFGGAERRRAHALHVTPYQLLIVASMVEREALLASDRPKVAAVIYNRLRLGMALGIDSTIRYALNDFTKPLTEAQLRIDSPYNTRTHRGLPPTPISNPGMAAIEAAARPARVPYLYYVNGADGCGELVFSTSYAQFERNAAAYQRALAANGGRVPTCRKR